MKILDLNGHWGDNSNKWTSLMMRLHNLSAKISDELEFSDDTELKIAMSIKFKPFLEHSNKTTNSNPIEGVFPSGKGYKISNDKLCFFRTDTFS